jgi:hypothetical protein
MTTGQRLTIARLIEAARARAERAAYLGDRAGSLVAAGEARRLSRQLDADRMAAQ